MAFARQRQRYASAAGTDIEDPCGGPLDRRAVRQLPPQRQIGAVGAALQVVPDDVLRAHHHALRASPRAISSSRSASIAVYVGSAYRVVLTAGRSTAAWRNATDRSGCTRIRSGSIPAYLNRTASSAARLPLHVTRRTRPLSSSKSASQIQDTS